MVDFTVVTVGNAPLVRIIVAGGRDFNDYELLSAELIKYIREIAPDAERDGVAIVSGAAAGADTLGARFARLNHMPLHVYPAEWDIYGKLAGFRRNKIMARNADYLLAFWDGKSSGTLHMIKEAPPLPVKIVRY